MTQPRGTGHASAGRAGGRNHRRGWRQPSMSLLLLPLGVLAACTPYSVGQRAHTVPKGEVRPTLTVLALPGGSGYARDSSTRRPLSLDVEVRKGIDDVSDVGLRINSFFGIIGTYRRRFDPARSENDMALSFMAGGGTVNALQHAHMEITFLASGPETYSVVPYGGLRALHVLPLSSVAVRDVPTFGAFSGVRIGGAADGRLLELGLFRDPSALGLREGNVVFVPSVSVSGQTLRRVMGWLERW